MKTRQDQPAWPYAAAGALAAVAGIAAGHLTAALVNPDASPVIAVGSAVIDATPTPVKEWAVSTFGNADKPILLGSVGLVTLAAAAGIGLLARRRRGLPWSCSWRSRGSPEEPPCSADRLITRRPARPRCGHRGPRDPDRPAGPGSRAGRRSADTTRGDDLGGGDPRRATAAILPLGAAGVTAGAAVAGALGQKLAANPTVPSAADLPAPQMRLGPLPSGLESRVRGLSPFRTPNRSFYRVDTSLIIPRVDAGSWRLEVDGDVDTSFSLTYAELLDLPMIERDITLTCVSNEVGGGYVSSARWLGVRVRDLLERAGIRPGVDQILSTSTTGFTISTPVQALTDDRDALVAVAMNGEPLPARHGFPARLVTPGLYGFVGCTKWLAQLTATTYAKDTAYWTERGWATDAPVLTQSHRHPEGTLDREGGCERAHRGRRLGPGPRHQGRGGPRRRRRVVAGDPGPEAGVDYWRQWYVRWTPRPGGSGTP